MKNKDLAIAYEIKKRNKTKYADGGMVKEEGDTMRKSIAQSILDRKKDIVDIEENGKEQPNKFYELNKQALKENYDSDLEDVQQPEDSNMIGNEDENPEDMISQIRAKMLKTRMFGK